MAAEERTQLLQRNLDAVRERIASAAQSAGREAGQVRLVVITKYFPLEDVRRLIGLGVTDFGENKDQEAAAKFAGLSAAERAGLTLHFVGQLQSNKAGHVASYADVVQSVDRVKIARALARGAERAQRRLTVMLQVDLDGSDPGRGGALPGELDALATQVAEMDRLELAGLMAVAPRGADPAGAFERLAELSARLIGQHPGATAVSAGMSGDLEQAVAHGATHVRIGSAVLGARPGL